MDSLFDLDQNDHMKFAPLAERMRPKKLSDVVGQELAVGPNSFLAKMIQKDMVPSILLFGPPGCGKTTIATVIANITKSKFVKLNATASGIKEIRDLAKARRMSFSFIRDALLFLLMKFIVSIKDSRIFCCHMLRMEHLY